MTKKMQKCRRKLEGGMDIIGVLQNGSRVRCPLRRKYRRSIVQNLAYFGRVIIL